MAVACCASVSASFPAALAQAEKGGETPPPTWVDETKISAAERAWSQACETLRKGSQQLLDDCSEKLSEFRQLADRASYITEMGVVTKRHEWLQAAMCKEREKLQGLIEAQHAAKDSSAAAAAETGTTTEDMSAVARAPPCACWAKLRTISELQNLGNFHECRSQSDIKSKNEFLKGEKENLNKLVAATRSALSDMQTAKKRADASRKREEEKAKKQKEKRQQQEAQAQPKRRRKSTIAGNTHPLLDLDLIQQPIASLKVDGQFPWKNGGVEKLDASKPWVLRVPSDVLQNCLPSQELDSFASVFKASALRVTEGVASRKLSEEVASVFVKSVGDLLENMFYLGPDSSMEPKADEAVAKAMSPVLVAMVPQHVSLAKFSAALMPTSMLCFRGTFSVGVWTAGSLVESAGGKELTNDFQMRATRSHAEDVQQASARGEISAGTMGPGDMLYLPPGALLSIQAPSPKCFNCSRQLPNLGFVVSRVADL